MTGQPGWRLWLTLLVSGVLACVISIVASVKIADANTQDQIDRARAAAVQQRNVTCALLGRILAAYEETPPTTATGRNVVEAWLDEYRTIGCLPRK